MKKGERARKTPFMSQDTSEECRRGVGYSADGSEVTVQLEVCGCGVSCFFFFLVYLTRSSPVPSQKHGL